MLILTAPDGFSLLPLVFGLILILKLSLWIAAVVPDTITAYCHVVLVVTPAVSVGLIVSVGFVAPWILVQWKPSFETIHWYLTLLEPTKLWFTVTDNSAVSTPAVNSFLVDVKLAIVICSDCGLIVKVINLLWTALAASFLG